MGMVELIPGVRELWKTRRDDINSSADKILEAVQQVTGAGISGDGLDMEVLNRAFRGLSDAFDGENGGFGTAPKFPTPHNLLFLLRYWKRLGDKESLSVVEKTLNAMRRGGVYNQVGYGFHRYSTDSKWLVPHFEKMLYDQSMLAMAYTEAFQATGKALYRQVAREILDYVLRDMWSPDGAFYSAEDADSEGEEGKFYLWSYDELFTLLRPEEFAVLKASFVIDQKGNYREEASRQLSGQNILYLPEGRPFLPESVRQKLFEAREKRVHPFKDDKVLTIWNGLMIAALARAAGVFGDAEYETAARKAADFVMTSMRSGEGRLFHRYREGEAAVTAFDEDYAYFIWALMELYEATFDSGYMKTAFTLMEEFIEGYWDDSVLPSPNSVALLCPLKLAKIGENREYQEKAEKLIPGTLKPNSEKPPWLYLLSQRSRFFYRTFFRGGDRRELRFRGHERDGRRAQAGVPAEKDRAPAPCGEGGCRDLSLSPVHPRSEELERAGYRLCLPELQLPAPHHRG